MRTVARLAVLTLLCLFCSGALLAQQPESNTAAVERLLRFSGTFDSAIGQAPAPVERATIAIYGQAVGGTPLWQETQSVEIDSEGRFAVLVGATSRDGLPPGLFAWGEARWIEVSFLRAGETELPRTLVTSVPYAFKALTAADAQMLGGRPASDYQLVGATAAAGTAAGNVGVGVAASSPGAAVSRAGTPQAATMTPKVGADTGGTGGRPVGSKVFGDVTLSVAGLIESTGIGSGGIKFPDGTTQTTAAAGAGVLAGDVTGTQSATVVSQVGGVTAANVAAGANAANAATSANTANTIVKRDGSGNLTAGTIIGNVTGNVSGSAASFMGALAGDVTGTQSATAIAAPTVTGKVLTGFVSGAGAITASDTVLTAIDKLDGNIALKAPSASPTFSGFVGIGTSTPTTAFTGFAMKNNVNNFYGTYIDAGPSGIPFYGYALSGVAKSYLAFNGPNNSLEYHQSSDATPDFYVNGNTKAVFNTGFVGIGTSTPTTGFTGFAMKSAANNFFGSYIDAGSTGIPFYGYALNGVAKSYLAFNGPNSSLEYHQSSDATPDFYVNGNTKAVFNTGFVGIGTGTPTTPASGFTMKNNVNGYYGMYVDAGTTGQPFYGYALNGIGYAWTELNGTNGNWELYYSGVRVSVAANGNVGIGTGPGTQKLDVGGTIHALNLNGGATTLSTDASGNIIRTPSDASLKRDISQIKGALAKVLQLHGVTYRFKDAQRFGGNRQMGFLAQDLEGLVPEAVSSGGEYKSVNYPVLTALLAEAIKAQQRQIDRQAKESQRLKKLVNQLVNRARL